MTFEDAKLKAAASKETKLRKRLDVRLTEMRKEIESDERFRYPSANIRTNAPLALIQVELKAKHETIVKILGLIDVL